MIKGWYKGECILKNTAENLYKRIDYKRNYNEDDNGSVSRSDTGTETRSPAR